MALAFAPVASCVSPHEAELASVAALAARAGRATVLVPTFAARDAWRRALAEMGHGMAVDVATPEAWIATLWELMGSGERVIGGAERALLATHAAVQEGHATTLTSGVVELIARAAQTILPQLVATPSETRASLSSAEQRLLSQVDAYAEFVHDRGLIEISAAAAKLSAQMVSSVPASARAVVVSGIGEYPAYLLDLLSVLAQRGEVLVLVEPEGAAFARDVSAAFEQRGAVVATGQDAGGAGRGARALREPSDAVRTCPQHVQTAAVAGPTARGAAYARLVLKACEVVATSAKGEVAPPVTVAAPDPLALFRELAPRLALQGVTTRVRASVPFERTRPGELFCMLADLAKRMAEEEPGAWWPAPELVDWLRSPFAGLGAGAARVARAFDTHLRKTRATRAETLMRELTSLQSREANRERIRADEAGEEPRPVVAASVFEAVVRGRYARALKLMRDAVEVAAPAAFGAMGVAGKTAACAALDAACAYLEMARSLGVSEEEAALTLPQLATSVSYAMEPAADAVPACGAAKTSVLPEVQIGTLNRVPCREGVLGHVLLLDADASSYPLARRETALTLLADKLGCAALSLPSAAAQRAQMRHATEAGVCATLAFVAHDEHTDDRYPAFAYTEIEEAARAAGILQPAPELPDEGSLFANADAAFGEGVRVNDAPRRGISALDAHVVPYVLPSTRVVGGSVVPRTLSASQIENYLSCPYLWLLNNRVPTRRLDVGFGPIEMGNFVHDVMQRFHERLIECGLMRVTPDNVDACLAEMDEAFAEMRSDHARGKYTHGKYAREKRPQQIRSGLVPLDELERNQIEAMLPKLHEVVRYEATILSIFTPAYFERSFDKEGITYAGHPLGGRIDRVDVAPDAGSGERFVVIDYKNRSSVGEFACPDPTMMLEDGEEIPEGWLPGRDADRAPKVQTLIYATALERLGGCSAEGAVYLATRGPQSAGAVSDALALSEPPAFSETKVSPYPGIKRPRSAAKHDGSWSFHDLLAHVEEGVAAALGCLEGGDVAPAPASDSCTYCPFTLCEKRR